MSDEYIRKKDVVDLGVMMQTHLWTREQTYNAIFCLPTADVAPVVRCKDCKHSQKDELWGMRWCKGVTVKDEHFCADGERKDNEID